MSQLIKCPSNKAAARFRMATLLNLIIFALLFSFIGCTKDNLATRVLQPGTKCNIYSGVFVTGDMQPAQPVVVVSIYRTASSGLIYYNVNDVNGITWQIPDNDLQVIQ